MSESSRSVPMPMWMGIIVVLLLLLNLIFLFMGKSEKPGASDSGSGPITTSDEVKRIITRDNMDFALVISKEGWIVPVTADGKDYGSCRGPDQESEGNDGMHSCTLFKDGIHVKQIDQLVLSKLSYKLNPTCVVDVIIYNGKKYYYYDPSDPACAGMP